ncbi:MAG: AAA family ATPase [Desulfonauticus sp.]|nr:AAA family ATPase [Desulfonauticus sp.]
MSQDFLAFLGLKENPFPLATNPDVFFPTEANKRILEVLWHGITSYKGFFVLVGEVGVGKTSFALYFMQRLKKKQIPFVWIYNTSLEPRELFLLIAKEFGLKKGSSLGEIQKALYDFAYANYKNNRICVIIIDEAQNLPPSTLEALRMFTNVEYKGLKLIQVLLIGQPELKHKLNLPELKALKSRVAILLHLPPLTREELQNYINFRLSIAGAFCTITPGAVDLLWKITGGNLRLANLVLERTLYALIVEDKTKIDKKIVKLALKDIQEHNVNNKKKLKRRIFLFFAVFCIVVGIILVFEFRTIKMPFFQNLKLGELFSNIDHLVNSKSISNLLSDKKASLPTVVKKNNPELSFIQQRDNFLGPWKDENLFSWFKLSVQLKDPEILAKHLSPHLKLLKLEAVPKQRKDNWTCLYWKQYVPESEVNWLVLWEPRWPISPLTEKNIDLVKIIQKKLFKLGFYTAQPTGKWDLKTKQALKKFQKKYGLLDTEILDLNTIFWLEQLN